MTAAVMSFTRSHFLPVWERHYPMGLGFLAAIAWTLWGYRLVCYSDAQNWHFDQIYVAFFGFASITTGFLATFYGTIQSMSSGFIQRIRNTRSLSGFLRFTKYAIIAGFAASVLTVPMLVIQPVPKDKYSVASIGVGVWLGIAVWSISCFWRVVSSLFLLFEAGEGGRPAG
jgi:hypothetical protein